MGVEGEKDTSVVGVPPLPLYVLSLGLAGGVLKVGLKPGATKVRNVIVCVGAGCVMIAGGVVIGLLVASGGPIGAYWGWSSSSVLLVLLFVSAVGVRGRTVETTGESGASADVHSSRRR
jgi:hypothetical protein